MKQEDVEEIERERRRRRNWEWIGNFQRDLIAGAVMGGLVHTIVAPIERAKLLIQTQESNAALLRAHRRRFRGMADCIARTVREEGVLSLWRGNGTSVIRYYPSVALNFSLKVISHHYFPKNRIFSLICAIIWYGENEED